MPNKKYQKGYRFENKLVHLHSGPDKISFRSAGSHSPVDVVAIDLKKKTIKLIQAKASREKVIKPFDTDEFTVSFVVARKLKGKVIYE